MVTPRARSFPSTAAGACSSRSPTRRSGRPCPSAAPSALNIAAARPPRPPAAAGGRGRWRELRKILGL